MNQQMMWEWLTKRDRWASVRPVFGPDGVYGKHTVTWYQDDRGWLHAEGQSFEEAVSAAMEIDHGA